MAESFDKALEALKTYQDDRLDSLRGKQANKWSTTPYSDYASMLSDLDSSDIASDYQAHYQELVSDSPGGDVAKEQSLRWQTTFVGNIRRAIRAKLISSTADRRGSVDQRRFAAIDSLTTRVLMDRIGKTVKGKEGS